MPVLPSGYMGNTLGSTLLRSASEGAFGKNAFARTNSQSMFQYSGASSTSGVAGASVTFPNASSDWRVRITLPPNADYFGLKDGTNALLSPLITESSIPSQGGLGRIIADGIAKVGGNIFGTNSTPSGNKRVGVIFPYTPTISMTHTATYEPQKLVHNNYTQYHYSSSDVGAISITAEFTVQNITEGQYLLACIYFFRTVTKMFFGQDKNAGNPPPIVYLNGYGQYYLPNVPCVVTSFQHTMPAECDYIDIPEPTLTQQGYYNPKLANYRLNSTRLPTTSSMVISVQPIYSRLAQSQGFSLEDFSRGALINPVGSALPSWGGGASTTAGKNVSNSKNGGFL